MLVLSRKIKEQILIGNDVRITLLRIDGNKVRIGIDAPKEVRVIRGELSLRESESEDAQSRGQISDREEAFAHPVSPAEQSLCNGPPQPANRLSPQGRMGLLKRDTPTPRRAPLANFVTAS